MQANYPKLSADVAGSRKFDVYMGIDVFGRGTYGGGQWTVRMLKSLCLTSNKRPCFVKYTRLVPVRSTVLIVYI